MDGSHADDATTKAFEYAMQNEKRIRSMLLKSARGDRQLADEMFSDVALERLPRLFELYDASRPIDNYMLHNIRWYAFKYMNKRRHYAELEHTGIRDKHGFTDALDSLNELDRYLIEAHVLYGMTFTEISKDLNWPVHLVSKAVKIAKDRVAECYDENRDWVFVKRVIRILCNAVE
jgi:DNA-directed RNA polymerase specialized sigma24 family protein